LSGLTQFNSLGLCFNNGLFIPLTGLYAAFVVGLVTSILGGRPGISGATGAIAVVIVALAISLYGPEYIFATVVLQE
jgi:SulP family sulfate permease